MKYKKTIAAIAIASIGMPQLVSAISTTYSDKATFLTDTGASSATGALPSPGNVGTSPYAIGNLTLQSASGNLYVGGSTDWTTRLPGNDIAISGIENLDVGITLPGNTFSFGFDFVEPQFDPNLNAGFVDSTFTVTLLSGAAFVDSFTYNAPNDVAAFVGVWSSAAFDGVEIRETVGGIGNEFFGEMYAGSRSAAVPEAGATFGLLALAMAGMMGARRRLS